MISVVEIHGSYEKKVAILSALWRLACMHKPVAGIAGDSSYLELPGFYFGEPSDERGIFSPLGKDMFFVEADGIHYVTWIKHAADRKPNEPARKERVFTLEEALQDSDFMKQFKEPWYTTGLRNASDSDRKRNAAVASEACINRIARELESVRATLESTLFNQIDGFQPVDRKKR